MQLIKEEVLQIFFDHANRLLEENKINKDDLALIATELLDVTKSNSDDENLLIGLELFVIKWPMFEESYNHITAQLKEVKSDQSAEKMETLLKENKVDEALAVHQDTT